MEVENGPLEDHVPLQTGGFPLPCQFQGEYIKICLEWTELGNTFKTDGADIVWDDIV